jgi:hypothetical protein
MDEIGFFNEREAECFEREDALVGYRRLRCYATHDRLLTFVYTSLVPVGS